MKLPMLFLTMLALVGGHVPNASPAAKMPAEAFPSLIADMTEIFFPFDNKAVTVEIQNGDVEGAKSDAVMMIANMAIKQCKWEKPLMYYGDKIDLEFLITKKTVSVRARMDKSLCPEKN